MFLWVVLVFGIGWLCWLLFCWCLVLSVWLVVLRILVWWLRNLRRVCVMRISWMCSWVMSCVVRMFCVLCRMSMIVFFVDLEWLWCLILVLVNCWWLWWLFWWCLVLSVCLRWFVLLVCGCVVFVISGIWWNRNWNVNCRLRILSGRCRRCVRVCRILRISCVLVVRWFVVKCRRCSSRVICWCRRYVCLCLWICCCIWVVCCLLMCWCRSVLF